MTTYSVINLINGICRSELAHLEPIIKLCKICQKMYQCVEMPSKIIINSMCSIYKCVNNLPFYPKKNIFGLFYSLGFGCRNKERKNYKGLVLCWHTEKNTLSDLTNEERYNYIIFIFMLFFPKKSDIKIHQGKHIQVCYTEQKAVMRGQDINLNYNTWDQRYKYKSTVKCKNGFSGGNRVRIYHW